MSQLYKVFMVVDSPKTNLCLKIDMSRTMFHGREMSSYQNLSLPLHFLRLCKYFLNRTKAYCFVLCQAGVLFLGHSVLFLNVAQLLSNQIAAFQ